ncbi:MAG: hypothetical protein ACFCUX_08290 [Candidatus Methylacidiphilales bacterium]
MFYTLLLVTFILSTLVAAITAQLFRKPAASILKRIIQDDIHSSWLTYLIFALYVVGISSGVRIYDIEKYIKPMDYRGEGKILELTPERWVLEVYRTVIESLQGLAWVLLVFFVVALIMFMLIRVVELFKKARQESA